MNKRERVIASLQHREPDRVPLDLGSMDTTGITGVAYNRLKAHLGLAGSPTRIHPVPQVAIVEDSVLELARADVKPVALEPLAWRPGQLPDGSPCEFPDGWRPRRQADGSWVLPDEDGIARAIMTPGSYYFDPINPPLADATTARDVDRKLNCITNFDLPACYDEPFERLGARARRLYETTDYALAGNFAVHVFAAGQRLRGFEQFMMDLLADPDMAQCILERLVDAFIERFDRFYAAVGPYIQVVNVADDLGTQSGLQLSPELYRAVIKPHHQRLYRHIKKHPGLFLMLHSDGAIRGLIPDLIEIGVDILNPVQFTCAGMDLKELKAEFGQDVAFWGGGCDTQTVLSSASPAEVKAHVGKCLEILMPGGGFIFNQLHNIQPEVPPENVMAMYAAVHEFGRY